MILEEIRLKDFRCFYGECAITFSRDPVQNVTLIYAENGVGKTTLLNALLWCFYGETTARFEKSEDILNYDAQSEGRSLASVEVLFEHNGNDYIAKRFFRASKAANTERSFRVARIEEGGHQNYIEPEDTFISSVIPKQMAGHFLFDGEHAEIFLGEKNKSAIRSAVRDILGCTLIETAIDDLQAVSNNFRRQIPTTALSEQIAGLNDQIDALSSQIETADESVKDLEREYESTEQQIADIEDKLRNTAQAKGLQSQRDDLEGQLKRTQRRKNENEADVFRWLGENGRFIVSKRITEEAFDFIDSEENRGGIPSPYNEEFVKDLLEREVCICGASIEPGSEIARKVASLLERAANQTMRDRISKVRARLSNLRTEHSKAPSRLMSAKKKLSDANEEISILEGKLGDIHDKLKGVNFGDIAEREAKREELQDRLSQIDRQIGAIKENTETARNDVTRYERDINQLAEQDKETKIFAKRRTLCETIKGALETRLLEEESASKGVLRASIRKILEETTRKNLTLKMSEDYVISLVNADGITLPKSSGENQLLGLAFTAALVEFAKIRKDAQSQTLLPGTIAPLVLDSPFGQLDRVYRSATAEFMPKMASQVVLLLSESQGAEEVIEVLSPYIGAEYVLVRHNKGPIGDRKIETRRLKNQEIQTTVFDSEYDGTEITKVA